MKCPIDYKQALKTRNRIKPTEVRACEEWLQACGWVRDKDDFGAGWKDPHANMIETLNRASRLQASREFFATLSGLGYTLAIGSKTRDGSVYWAEGVRKNKRRFTLLAALSNEGLA